MQNFSTFACASIVICSVQAAWTGVAQEEDVNWLRHLAQRWSARHFSLVCPQCRQRASSLLYKRGRFMLGDDELVCEQCGTTSVVTFWRFEGLSCQGRPNDSGRHQRLANWLH